MGIFKRRTAPSITVDEQGVRREIGKTVESVTWTDLQRVELRTTAAGPAVDDVFWVLHGSAGGVVVPSTDAPDLLLDRLQRLPGFDNESVIRAMSSTDDATFVCWVRDS